jgi:hypothetical protein
MMMSVWTGGIVSAYRRCLVRNLAGNRCADSGGNALSSEALDSFNRNLASAADSNRAPLTPDDLRPAQTQGQADWEVFIDEKEFDRAWEDFLDLLLGKGHGPLLSKGTKTYPTNRKARFSGALSLTTSFVRSTTSNPKMGNPSTCFSTEK